MDKSLREQLNRQAALQEQEELQVAERQIDEDIAASQGDPRLVAIFKSLKGWLQNTFADMSTAPAANAPVHYSSIFAAVATVKAAAAEFIQQHIKPKAPARPDARYSHYWFDRAHHRNPAVENQAVSGSVDEQPLPSYAELDDEAAQGLNLEAVPVPA